MMDEDDDEFPPSYDAEDHGFDQTQACLEGWGLFNSDGSDNGPFQLCRIDSQDDPDGKQLNDDDEAWDVVIAKAREGSAYHLGALDLIEKLNPMEREAIRKTTGF